MKISNAISPLLLSALLFSGTAGANIVQDNLTDNYFLNSSGISNRIFGQFDLSGQVYDNLIVTFSFVDETYMAGDDDPLDRGEPDDTNGGYWYRDDTWGYSRFPMLSEHITYFDQDIIETANINIANIAMGSASSSYMERHQDDHEHDEHGHGWLHGEQNCNTSCEDGYLMRHSIDTTGYTGFFSFNVVIPKSLIDANTTNGLLEFNVSAVSGDFKLISATAETSVEEVPGQCQP